MQANEGASPEKARPRVRVFKFRRVNREDQDIFNNQNFKNPNRRWVIKVGPWPCATLPSEDSVIKRPNVDLSYLQQQQQHPHQRPVPTLIILAMTATLLASPPARCHRSELTDLLVELTTTTTTTPSPPSSEKGAEETAGQPAGGRGGPPSSSLDKSVEHIETSFEIKRNSSRPINGLFEGYSGSHDDDEDEDEFYTQNPVEVRNNFDVEREIGDIKAIRLNDTDFAVDGEEEEEDGNGDKFNSTVEQRLNERFFGAPIRKGRRKGKRDHPRQPDSTASRHFVSRTEAHKAAASSSEKREEEDLLEAARLQACAVPLMGRCLTYLQIEEALERARARLRFRRPRDLESVEPSEASINCVGELTELTTRLLAEQLALAWDEISFAFEQMDVSQSSLWSTCPALFREAPNCNFLTRYRTHTGQCNNPYLPLIGASRTPYVRSLPPDYADGVGAPRRSSRSLGELPPARLLALHLHPDLQVHSARHSALFSAWGQLVNHDLSLASAARPSTGHRGACCGGVGSAGGGRVCMPIEIGADDPLYSQYGIRCHDFKRSLAGLRPRCTLGPRTQINLATSWLDASFIYGAHRSASDSLRGNRRGLLEMWDYFQGEQLLALLPAQLEAPDEECVGRESQPEGHYCFRSGDPRANQQIQLIILHTIHARQHNRLAGALSRLNPLWTNNKVYHEARHIHIAMVQHILLSEYLPALLGERLVAKYNLTEAPAGTYWDHYEPQINPGISQAFSAAAFRQGHSTVPGQVFRFNRWHEPIQVHRLREFFRQPWALYEPGALDEFLLGTLDAPAEASNPFVTSDLSGHLLEMPEEPFGLDLTAINIQRGRDQGVAGYNAYREWCGLGRVGSFEELDAFMSNRSSYTMSLLYESPDDIDLFTGGLSEFPLEDAQVGPTFACIIGRQFSTLRSGDRFWFESSLGPHSFSPAQLASIKQVSLARLLCANSDSIVTIQQMALHQAHPVLNPRQFCHHLADLDISLWFDPLAQEQPPGAAGAS